MKYRDRMPGVKLFMALGATIDFEAGTLKRAPVLWQKIGMEWLYRVLKEPRRLFRRYFVDDMQFFFYFAKFCCILTYMDTITLELDNFISPAIGAAVSFHSINWNAGEKQSFLRAPCLTAFSGSAGAKGDTHLVSASALRPYETSACGRLVCAFRLGQP